MDLEQIIFNETLVELAVSRMSFAKYQIYPSYIFRLHYLATVPDLEQEYMAIIEWCNTNLEQWSCIGDDFAVYSNNDAILFVLRWS